MQIRNRPCTTVIDCGAQVTIVSMELFEALKWSVDLELVLLKGIDKNRRVEGYHVKNVPLTLGGKTYNWDIYVAPIADDMLLGLDFMVTFGIDILITRSMISVQGQEIPVIFKQGPTNEKKVGRVLAQHKVVVPPNSVRLVSGHVTEQMDGPYMLAPAHSKSSLTIPYVTSNVNNQKFPVPITNMTDSFITVKKGTVLGSLEEVQEVLESQEDDSSDIPQVRTIHQESSESSEDTEPSDTPDDSTSSDSTDIQAELGKMQSQMPDHLRDMYLKSVGNLTDEQTLAFGKLLIEFEDTFAKTDIDLGLCTVLVGRTLGFCFTIESIRCHHLLWKSVSCSLSFCFSLSVYSLSVSLSFSLPPLSFLCLPSL